MPDEIEMTQEQWQQILAAQIEKTKQSSTPKPPKIIAAQKPYTEKSFVSVHYTALGGSFSDTQYNTRDPQTYAVIHFYLREGDTFQALQRDARNYSQTFPHSKIIAHDHPFNEPCSPAPKLRKCKEV